MTMHSHFSHSMTLARPLFVLVGVVAIVGLVGFSVVDPLVTDDPHAAPVVAAVGAGIDEFSLQARPVFEEFIPAGFGGWILAAALFVTAWSILALIRALRARAARPRDVGTLIRQVVRRTSITLGARSPDVPWGIVRDAQTGDPIVLAMVQLTDADGAVLDSCVSDARGQYGFQLSYASVVGRGYRVALQSRKSGYYFPPAGSHHYRGGQLLLAVSANQVHPCDLAMDCIEAAPRMRIQSSHLWNWLSTLAFWAGVVLVPLAFLQEPNLLRSLIFGVFVSVGVVRASWRSPSQ